MIARGSQFFLVETLVELEVEGICKICISDTKVTMQAFWG
jgi:hypothetical protein